MAHTRSIAIFGASVTQQKDGYAAHLGRLFTETVCVFGYGGMHLKDAGVCFIDHVLAKDPAYCFVDWFSTDYTETSERTTELIDTIVYRFSRAGCKLIFLFLPRADSSTRVVFEQFCKKYLESQDVFYIDVGTEIGDLSGILRDLVHTTEYGSTKYADVIYKLFTNNVTTISIPDNTGATHYTSISKLSINRTFNNTLELKGKAQIIGFMLTVGPHSGLVEISDGHKTTTVNTWDVWCHYRRRHFSVPCTVDGGIVLRVLQDSFDTSTTGQPYDYAGVAKELIVHDIYYVGGDLKLLHKSTGRKIRGRGPVRKAAARVLRPFRKSRAR